MKAHGAQEIVLRGKTIDFALLKNYKMFKVVSRMAEIVIHHRTSLPLFPN